MGDDDDFKPKTFKHPLNDPDYKGEKTSIVYTDGPAESRGFTDCLMLIVFILFWIGMIIIAGMAFSKGNPQDLETPYDSAGYPCGQGNNSGFPYIYFVDGESLPPNFTLTVCVSICPNSASISTTLQCSPNYYVDTCNWPTYATQEVFKVCVPTGIINGSDASWNEVTNLGDLNQGFHDIKTVWWVVLIVALIALIVGFIYLLLIRYCAGIFIWTIILLYLIGLLLFGVICYQNATGSEIIEVNNSSIAGFQQSTQKALAYTSFTIFGISLILLLCLFSRIKLAIAVLKCAAQFVETVPSVLFVPPAFFLLSLGFYIFWAFSALYIASMASTPTSAPMSIPFSHVAWTSEIKGFLAYYIIALIWNHMFLIAMVQFVIAAATVIWYFGSSEGRTPKKPVTRALCWGLFYHLGSIAFGSLIITILEIIKIVVNILYSEFKKLTVNSGAQAGAVKFAVICCTCCLDCFERFMRFINKHAYIQIAMTGKSFCGAAHDAFFLAVRNGLRFGVVHGIGDVFIWIGDLFITFLSAFIGYLIISHGTLSSEISSPFYPTICFALLSFVIASNFMNIYGISSDTIIHCFCMDEEMHDDEARHAPKLLREFVHHHLPKKTGLLEDKQNISMTDSTRAKK
jgi:solute carrier family 44 protein 1 (choline transporter-like protein)/choline transporter-like protein 2/4/5